MTVRHTMSKQLVSSSLKMKQNSTSSNNIPSSLNKLQVLLWKHFLVRTRRYVNTAAEILGPLILFVALYMSKEHLLKDHSVTHVERSGVLSYPDQRTLNSPIHRIVYMPYTSKTSLLMAEVGKILHLTELDLPPDHSRKGYWGLNNQTSLEQFERYIRSDEALVIFENLPFRDLWPLKLNYTIRLKEHYLVPEKTIASFFDNINTVREKGPNEERFMRLQWAVDRSYLKLLSGVNLRQYVKIQEFPRWSKISENPLMIVLDPLLKLCTFFSLILPFVLMSNRLLEERASGMKELIKMSDVSSIILGASHFINVIPSMLIFSGVVTYLLKRGDMPLVPLTSSAMIFFMLLLHYSSLIAFAFAVSYIVNTNDSLHEVLNIMEGTLVLAAHGTSVATVLYIIMDLPSALVYAALKSKAFNYMSALVPRVPVDWFWEELCSLESRGSPLTMSDMYTSHSELSGPVALAVLGMTFHVVFFLALSWYLDKVRPGYYGVAQPWNFIFRSSYWTGRSKLDTLTEEEIITQPRDPKYFEAANPNLEVGIKIVNVTKVFSAKNIALSRLTFDIYKGEITVLLGHNGAGKTTLMSIISGLMSATEGEVYVNGAEVKTQRAFVSRSMGLCPQHNVSFPNINVGEHIKFFSMLKGHSYKTSDREVKDLIQQLRLEGKERSMATELSGGMKRRLQLACALAGDANVLILDEPTSGLDVETRRELWNLLLSLRGTRTVLLSTHYMEEADVLGDRVAALHAGILRCFASPMFLKQAIGTGYRLNLSVNSTAQEKVLTKTLRNHIPEAKVLDRTQAAYTYEVPGNNSDKFPSLFQDLEKNKKQLGIETIGVGVATLDEVFLKLCSDVDTSDIDAAMDKDVIKRSEMKKISGFGRYINIVQELFKRQLKATYSTITYFILLQIFLPIVVIWLLTYASNSPTESDPPSSGSANTTLQLYEDIHPKKVILNIKDVQKALRTLKYGYEDTDFVLSEDVNSDIIEIGKQNINEYKKYIIGLTLTEDHAVVQHTPSLRYSAPVALNLLSNIMAATLLPWEQDGHTITTVNQPIKLLANDKAFKKSKGNAALNWSLLVPFILMATLINEVNLPCLERVTGSRHYQIMSGCPPAVYWAVTLIYDTATYTMFNVLPTILACVVLEKDSTINRYDFLWAFFTILVIGGVAFLSFMYVLSWFFSNRVSNVVLLVVLFIFGVIVAVTLMICVQVEVSNIWTSLLKMFSSIFPPFPVIFGGLTMVNTATKNGFCHLNKEHCPNLPLPPNEKIFTECCESKSSWGPELYFTFNNQLPQVFALIASAVVYFILVVLLENGMGRNLYEKVINRSYVPRGKRYNDKVAKSDSEYVQENINNPPKDDSVLVHKMHKKYFKCCDESVYAVNGISFSVIKGEIFGLLGVNGAGKSTTFKMLTAEEAMTRGQVYADGNYIQNSRSKYLYSLGYCPQFGGVDDFLTGSENLRLLLNIRGLKTDDVDSEIKAWINCVGLEKYANRYVSSYSGGCKRRLSAAAALSTGAPVSLLDEPTAGVDAVARRRVWAALRQAVKQDRSVIITSHSMDEMEALCNRVAIMSVGEICALGSPPILRCLHASGHIVKLKLRQDEKLKGDQSDEDLTNDSGVTVLKEEIYKNFRAEIRDEHRSMLQFKILEKVPYSKLFKFMESLKQNNGEILEDYYISEPTLEEVFLSFAKNATESSKAKINGLSPENPADQATKDANATEQIENECPVETRHRKVLPKEANQTTDSDKPADVKEQMDTTKVKDIRKPAEKNILADTNQLKDGRNIFKPNDIKKEMNARILTDIKKLAVAYETTDSYKSTNNRRLSDDYKALGNKTSIIFQAHSVERIATKKRILIMQDRGQSPPNFKRCNKCQRDQVYSRNCPDCILLKDDNNSPVSCRCKECKCSPICPGLGRQQIQDGSRQKDGACSSNSIISTRKQDSPDIRITKGELYCLDSYSSKQSNPTAASSRCKKKKSILDRCETKVIEIIDHTKGGLKSKQNSSRSINCEPKQKLNGLDNNNNKLRNCCDRSSKLRRNEGRSIIEGKEKKDTRCNIKKCEIKSNDHNSMDSNFQDDHESINIENTPDLQKVTDDHDVEDDNKTGCICTRKKCDSPDIILDTEDYQRSSVIDIKERYQQESKKKFCRSKISEKIDENDESDNNTGCVCIKRKGKCDTQPTNERNDEESIKTSQLPDVYQRTYIKKSSGITGPSNNKPDCVCIKKSTDRFIKLKELPNKRLMLNSSGIRECHKTSPNPSNNRTSIDDSSRQGDCDDDCENRLTCRRKAIVCQCPPKEYRLRDCHRLSWCREHQCKGLPNSRKFKDGGGSIDGSQTNSLNLSSDGITNNNYRTLNAMTNRGYIDEVNPTSRPLDEYYSLDEHRTTDYANYRDEQQDTDQQECLNKDVRDDPKTISKRETQNHHTATVDQQIQNQLTDECRPYYRQLPPVSDNQRRFQHYPYCNMDLCNNRVANDRDILNSYEPMGDDYTLTNIDFLQNSLMSDEHTHEVNMEHQIEGQRYIGHYSLTNDADFRNSYKPAEKNLTTGDWRVIDTCEPISQHVHPIEQRLNEAKVTSISGLSQGHRTLNVHRSTGRIYFQEAQGSPRPRNVVGVQDSSEPITRRENNIRSNLEVRGNLDDRGLRFGQRMSTGRGFRHCFCPPAVNRVVRYYSRCPCCTCHDGNQCLLGNCANSKRYLNYDIPITDNNSPRNLTALNRKPNVEIGPLDKRRPTVDNRLMDQIPKDNPNSVPRRAIDKCINTCGWRPIGEVKLIDENESHQRMERTPKRLNCPFRNVIYSPLVDHKSTECIYPYENQLYPEDQQLRDIGVYVDFIPEFQQNLADHALIDKRIPKYYSVGQRRKQCRCNPCSRKHQNCKHLPAERDCKKKCHAQCTDKATNDNFLLDIVIVNRSDNRNDLTPTDSNKPTDGDDGDLKTDKVNKEEKKIKSDFKITETQHTNIKMISGEKVIIDLSPKSKDSKIIKATVMQPISVQHSAMSHEVLNRQPSIETSILNYETECNNPASNSPVNLYPIPVKTSNILSQAESIKTTTSSCKVSSI